PRLTMTAPFGAPPALNALGPPALGRSALLSSSLVHHGRGRQPTLVGRERAFSRVPRLDYLSF
ncbi:MAG: hypothetical protein ACLQFT_13610, partial [Steroidobacteraceae bacterium]